MHFSSVGITSLFDIIKLLCGQLKKIAFVVFVRLYCYELEYTVHTDKNIIWLCGLRHTQTEMKNLIY